MAKHSRAKSQNGEAVSSDNQVPKTKLELAEERAAKQIEEDSKAFVAAMASSREYEPIKVLSADELNAKYGHICDAADDGPEAIEKPKRERRERQHIPSWEIRGVRFDIDLEIPDDLGFEHVIPEIKEELHIAQSTYKVTWMARGVRRETPMLIQAYSFWNAEVRAARKFMADVLDKPWKSTFKILCIQKDDDFYSVWQGPVQDVKRRVLPNQRIFVRRLMKAWLGHQLPSSSRLTR